MGISISLLVSEAVAQDRWEAVYTEALTLAQKLQLASTMQKDILGHAVYCLTPVEEISDESGTYWSVSSDLRTRKSAEWYETPRVLRDAPVEADFDILIHHAIDLEILADEEINRRVGTGSRPRHLWGDKTQGHFYHLGLLAIGCLIQERLGNQAYVFGDITAGQCRRAVEMANEYLERPIPVPAQADLGRWINRVKHIKMPEDLKLPEADQVRIAFEWFIGAKQLKFGEAIREAFSHDSIIDYWKRAFEGYDMNIFGFSWALKSYLSTGFDLTELCAIVSFTSSKGEDQRATFIRHIMDSKMHWPEKDCTDWMVQDPESPSLYGVDALFVRFLGLGARNKKVDRFIPIDEIRRALKAGMPDYDVDAVIDDYLANESGMADSSVEVNRFMNEAHDRLQQKSDDYDIPIPEYLFDFRAGDTVDPEVEALVRNIMKFWHTEIMEGEDYKRIVAKPREELLDWLAYQSGRFPEMTLEEWQHLMEAVAFGPRGAERYCGLFCIKLNDDAIREAVRALASNDALYDYGMKLLEHEGVGTDGDKG